MSDSKVLSPERLFLRTLADVEGRCGSSDPYEILGIAGLVRKLLLDDYPLVDRVNRAHRLQIRFPVLDPLPASSFEGRTILVYDTADLQTPESHARNPERVKWLPRDAFLAVMLAYTMGHSLTVRDVVLFEANVAGGVHAPTDPKTDTFVALDDLRRRLTVRGQPMSLFHLRNVGRLVLLGLAPLRETIQRSDGAG